MSSTLKLKKETKTQIDFECVRIFEIGLMSFPIMTEEEAKQMIQLLRKRGITYISMFVALEIPDSTFRSWRNNTGNQSDQKKAVITNKVISFLNQRYQEALIAQQNESDSEDNDDNSSTESENSQNSESGENDNRSAENGNRSAESGNRAEWQEWREWRERRERRERADCYNYKKKFVK